MKYKKPLVRRISLLLFILAALALTLQQLTAQFAGNLRLLSVDGLFFQLCRADLPLLGMILLVCVLMLLLAYGMLYARRITVTLELQRFFRPVSRRFSLVPLHSGAALFLSVAAFLASTASLLHTLDLNEYCSTPAPRAYLSESLDNDSDMWFRQYTAICHMLGPQEGYAANSREALLHSYAEGQRVFEVDLLPTADGKIVCAHDWDSGTVPTEEEYLAAPRAYDCTAMNFADILLFMEEHTEVYMVTDTKLTKDEEVHAMFTEMYAVADSLSLLPVLDRLVVQIYNDSMLSAVREIYDFPHILYTMYQNPDADLRMPAGFAKIASYCAQMRIEGITMGAGAWKQQFAPIAEHYGIAAFCHTVNDAAQAEALLDAGVQGIYTDILLLNEPQAPTA